MRGHRLLAVIFALALAAAACSSGTESASSSSSTSTTQAPTTTQAPSTTTTSTTESQPITPQTLEVEYVLDLTWSTPTATPAVVGTDVQVTTGQEWQMTVAYPSDPPLLGWPVLVYFHGATIGTPLDGLDAVAKRGAVVISIRWIDPEWSVLNLNLLTAAEYADGYWFDVAGCALAAAQEVSLEYGGNPDRTTVAGFSAGIHPAARTGLGLVNNDLCEDRSTIPPKAMVLGDSQHLFHGDNWDETFLDSTSLATDTVDRFINPERWNLPPDFVAYLWSTESRAWEREVENPPAADSWLRTRTNEADELIADLAAVGAFDDGFIRFIDNGRLLELRLSQAGATVADEMYATNHTYAPDVYERIATVVTGEPLIPE